MYDTFLSLKVNKISNIRKEYVERGYFLRNVIYNNFGKSLQL